MLFRIIIITGHVSKPIGSISRMRTYFLDDDPCLLFDLCLLLFCPLMLLLAPLIKDAEPWLARLADLRREFQPLLPRAALATLSVATSLTL